MKKPKVNKNKKVSFSLPQKEGELLRLYAQQQGISRPDAIRRILKQFLKEHVQGELKSVPKNQLDIFDSVQIDIFNNTSKS